MTDQLHNYTGRVCRYSKNRFSIDGEYEGQYYLSLCGKLYRWLNRWIQCEIPYPLYFYDEYRKKIWFLKSKSTKPIECKEDDSSENSITSNSHSSKKSNSENTSTSMQITDSESKSNSFTSSTSITSKKRSTGYDLTTSEIFKKYTSK